MPPSQSIEKHNAAVAAASPPDEFVCPLTLEIMSQPLVSRHGLINFERSAILTWLGQQNQCPLTRKPMAPSDLFPNKRLEVRIQDWKRKNGYGDDDELTGSSTSLESAAGSSLSDTDSRCNANKGPVLDLNTVDPRLDSLKLASMIKLSDEQKKTLLDLVRRQQGNQRNSVGRSQPSTSSRSTGGDGRTKQPSRDDDTATPRGPGGASNMLRQATGNMIVCRGTRALGSRRGADNIEANRERACGHNFLGKVAAAVFSTASKKEGVLVDC